MKTIMTIMALATLVTGCRNAQPKPTVTEAYLRQRIIGTWWSGDQWITEPFSFVTFFPDGRFTRSSTNGPIGSMRQGYWRVGHTNAITFTVEPGALPAADFMVFRMDQITGHRMVFSNSIGNGRIEFTR